mmetsp:Transcript_45701/g.108820  ORF Transcript_45701/g.108820 Transcript_45701/m.108820 type:complete len:338 (-) Transcript_45701:208-1221(-)
MEQLLVDLVVGRIQLDHLQVLVDREHVDPELGSRGSEEVVLDAEVSQLAILEENVLEAVGAFVVEHVACHVQVREHHVVEERDADPLHALISNAVAAQLQPLDRTVLLQQCGQGFGSDVGDAVSAQIEQRHGIAAFQKAIDKQLHACVSEQVQTQVQLREPRVLLDGSRQMLGADLSYVVVLQHQHLHGPGFSQPRSEELHTFVTNVVGTQHQIRKTHLLLQGYRKQTQAAVVQLVAAQVERAHAVVGCQTSGQHRDLLVAKEVVAQVQQVDFLVAGELFTQPPQATLRDVGYPYSGVAKEVEGWQHHPRRPSSRNFWAAAAHMRLRALGAHALLFT